MRFDRFVILFIGESIQSVFEEASIFLIFVIGELGSQFGSFSVFGIDC